MTGQCQKGSRDAVLASKAPSAGSSAVTFACKPTPRQLYGLFHHKELLMKFIGWPPLSIDQPHGEMFRKLDSQARRFHHS
jgi:hypothetical protein